MNLNLNFVNYYCYFCSILNLNLNSEKNRSCMNYCFAYPMSFCCTNLNCQKTIALAWNTNSKMSGMALSMNLYQKWIYLE